MAMSTDDLVENSLNKFITLTQNPEELLSTHETLFKKFRDTTKNVYDISKTTEHRKNVDQALPELIVESFDEEQIWQEIELQNDSMVTELVSNIAGLTSAKLPLTFCQLKARKEKERLIEEKQIKVVKFDSIEENSSDNEDESDEKSECKESSDDTDNELDNIKSRLLMTGEDSDDDNDADFDISALSEEFKDVDDEEKEDIANDDENHETVFTLDNHNEFSDSKQISSKKKKKSVVDDKFFKLAIMEEFLIQEDNKFEKQRKNDMNTTKQKSEESDEDNDEIDMFEAFPSDEDEQSKNARYEDFFDPPDDDGPRLTSKKADDQIDDEGDDSSDEGDSGHEQSESDDKPDEVGDKEDRNLLGDSESEGEDIANILGGASRKKKSTFEKRQEKLKEKISKMEEASLADKSWQLTGESSSQDRPENSLLEEHLDFENIAQLPPIITETTTHDLEQMIKQRIKDKAFNDVKRVIKPWEDPYEYKKRTELSHEKSNQSLSQIYEQAYNKQKHKEERIMEDPAHKKIEKKLQSLFVQLDALSNFHYTPKPAAPDVKIVSNLPSISMEEVAPVSVSDSKLLAPEEVKEKTKGGTTISTREKSSTDKKRDKRKKKADKKKRIKAKEEKMAILQKKHPELKEKLDRTKAKKKLQKNSRVTLLKSHKKRERAMLSSKKFFAQLQEEVSTNQKVKAAGKRKSSNTDGKNAKKFKL